MKINYVLNHVDSVEPKKACKDDAGFDLTAVSITNKEDYVEIDTGVIFDIPRGYVGLLFPRSSISDKDLSLCNSVGVIDSGYSSTVKFRFNKINMRVGVQSKLYNVGDRIGQLVIMPIPSIELVETKEVSKETERGSGGFGSSDAIIDDIKGQPIGEIKQEKPLTSDEVKEILEKTVEAIKKDSKKEMTKEEFNSLPEDERIEIFENLNTSKKKAKKKTKKKTE